MSEPKLTEARRQTLIEALDSYADLPAVVARMVATAEQTARAEGEREGYEAAMAKVQRHVDSFAFGASIPHLRTAHHNGAYDVVLVHELKPLLTEATP